MPIRNKLQQIYTTGEPMHSSSIDILAKHMDMMSNSVKVTNMHLQTPSADRVGEVHSTA